MTVIVVIHVTLILATGLQAVLAQPSIDQLKLEFQEIEKRMCVEPLPTDEQLDQMEKCSPIFQLAGKTTVQKCESDAFRGETNRQVVLRQYCAMTTEDRVRVDQSVYTCIMTAARADPSPELKQLLDQSMKWESMTQNERKADEEKRMEENNSRMRKVLECEKAALALKS